MSRESIVKSPWFSLAATLIAAYMAYSYYMRPVEEGRASDTFVFWVWVVITLVWGLSFVIKLRRNAEAANE